MKRLKLWWQKFGEAWTACSLAMVQGDLTVFTVSHALTAAKTGVGAATAILLASLFGSKWMQGYRLVWLTGLLTAIVDILVHPTHFGPHWMEAVCTGIGAMILAFIFEKLFRKN